MHYDYFKFDCISIIYVNKFTPRGFGAEMWNNGLEAGRGQTSDNQVALLTLHRLLDIWIRDCVLTERWVHYKRFTFHWFSVKCAGVDRLDWDMSLTLISWREPRRNSTTICVPTFHRAKFCKSCDSTFSLSQNNHNSSPSILSDKKRYDFEILEIYSNCSLGTECRY